MEPFYILETTTNWSHVCQTLKLKNCIANSKLGKQYILCNVI